MPALPGRSAPVGEGDELLENLDERKLKAWKEERARQAVACRDGKLRLFPEMLTCPPIDPDRRPGRVHQPVLPHPEALVALEGSLSRFPGVRGGSSHLLQLPRAVEGRTFTAQLAVSSGKTAATSGSRRTRLVPWRKRSAYLPCSAPRSNCPRSYSGRRSSSAAS